MAVVGRNGALVGHSIRWRHGEREEDTTDSRAVTRGVEGGRNGARDGETVEVGLRLDEGEAMVVEAQRGRVGELRRTPVITDKSLVPGMGAQR